MSENGGDTNHIRHMVFLVLDHNQPNPLFRAPIGPSPKVNSDRGCSGPSVPLTESTENLGHWNRPRQLGNVS